MSDFYSKILLFGEYAIIKGSCGLALPLKNFKGQLDFTENVINLSSKLSLDDFYRYLRSSSLISQNMNLAKLESDIKKGLYFKSDIPQGYGVGSSGALCAALFAEYAYNFERKENYTHNELNFLKDIMALMESFYHGTSSGIDCLISLINLPLFIENRSQVTLIIDPLKSIKGDFFLLDSGHARVTSALVPNFLAKYEKDNNYKQEVKKFIELTNTCISNVKNCESIDDSIYQLSRQQYLTFAKMIPTHLKTIWLEGLESREYFLKLCGAGGGGYFLLYKPESSRINTEVIPNLIRLSHG